MENAMPPCPTCGKLDQPHDPCYCPNESIKVGSVVIHTSKSYYLADMFRGPGTVTKLFREFDIDFATVLWQSSLVEFDHRVSNLVHVGQMIQKEGK